MMDKAMVQLNIPVVGESYDVLLPRTLSVRQATQLLTDLIAKVTGGAYRPDDNAVLCSMEDGKICQVNSSVEDLHLRNGSKLMLI